MSYRENKTCKSKQKHNNVTALVSILTHGGFSSTVPKASLMIRKEKSCNLCERKAYISYTKESLNSLHSRPRPRQTLRTRGVVGWGETEGRGGKKGEWRAGTSFEGTPWR